MWLIGFTSVWYIVRQATPKTITYDETKTTIFGNYVVMEIERGSIAYGDVTALIVFGGSGMLAIGILMLMTTL